MSTMKKPHWGKVRSEEREGIRTSTMSALYPVPHDARILVRLWSEEVRNVKTGQLVSERFWWKDRDHGYATEERCYAEALEAVDSGALEVRMWYTDANGTDRTDGFTLEQALEHLSEKAPA